MTFVMPLASCSDGDPRSECDASSTGGRCDECGEVQRPDELCDDDGGFGIGARHRCRCNRAKGHPIDSDMPHGCECGAPW